MRLADAQRLFDEPDLLSVISFKVDNLNRAPEIGAEIEHAAGHGFMTTNWMEQNRELFRALKLEQVVTFIVIALIVIVAALNILIALTMMVMEKTRDIAVMMSFGVEPGQIRRIFLLQGLLISLVGTALGLAARLPRRLGRRPLPLHPSLRRGLLHRHPALRPPPRRRPHRLRRLHRHLPPRHPLPLLSRRPRPPRRSAALRVTDSTSINMELKRISGKDLIGRNSDAVDPNSIRCQS